MRKTYKKWQYSFIRENAAIKTTNELAAETGIPVLHVRQFLHREKIEYLKMRQANDPVEVETFVKENYREFTVKQLAFLTKSGFNTIYSILQKHGLPVTKRKGNSSHPSKYSVGPDGYFNVHERENWLI